MTAPERASLERVEDKVDAGFREIRGLLESRRIEEKADHAELDRRLRVTELGYKVAAVLGTGAMGLALAVLNHVL